MLESGATSQLLPYVIIGIVATEAWAFVVLARDLASHASGERKPGGMLLIVLLLARAAVELIVLMNAFIAAGHSYENPLLGMGLMILVVGKFIVCLGVSLDGASRAASSRRLGLAATVVNLWSPVAYSLCWGKVVVSSPVLSDLRLGEAVVQTVVAGVLFLLLYAPLRIYAILAVLRGRRRAAREAAIIVGLGAVAMASLWGHDTRLVALAAELLGRGG
jgi:hypothetical protein